MQNLAQEFANGKLKIVDVRTPQEFMGGHVAGSINIPLNELPERMNELKSMENILLCCASGGRSMQATDYLRNYGIDCQNGGSWLQVNFELTA
jgi:rhodanese-related sulfurtransferase